MEERKEIASVPFYIHEAVFDKVDRTNQLAMLELGKSNRRMLIALVVVCVTLVITVCAFLFAYRKLNENWIDFYNSHVEEVYDGTVLHEGNQESHS